MGIASLHPSYELRRENADAHSPVIVREGGRFSIPEAIMIKPMSRGVLDPPHARGMTVEYCFAISASLRAQRSNPSFRMRSDNGLLRGAGARIRATRGSQ
ncbi:hypothetical protein J6524_15365 [Bradyrhizobium sp. WSM 1738]|uniref:hypothetical protein n=1 Tax=Bradyrhizobium hereditatis TaxID=2821405 RepID=UPI001CE32360|nr:hypothetical protein [Bradyrhizobium hereditatis]MCA6116265.1 hypothetical protein [Bradyrhizobium hereditatis]